MTHWLVAAIHCQTFHHCSWAEATKFLLCQAWWAFVCWETL